MVATLTYYEYVNALSRVRVRRARASAGRRTRPGGVPHADDPARPRRPPRAAGATAPPAPPSPASPPSGSPPASPPRPAPSPRRRCSPRQGNPGYDVRHYDVRLDYAPATNHLAAVTTLRATRRAPLSSFHLDLSGMRVSAVRVDGRPATWTRSGHELVVTPRRAVDGAFTVSSPPGGPTVVRAEIPIVAAPLGAHDPR